MKQLVMLKVNGEEQELAIEPHRTLLEVLREELSFTGTKENCDKGACGVCTVLLDGLPVPSCMVLALDAQGKEVVTIEGLSQDGQLHPVQKAFVNAGAVQCGFCTPGMVLATKALLDHNPNPTEEECRHAISGHLCRCTGYFKIIEAMQLAAAELRRQG